MARDQPLTSSESTHYSQYLTQVGHPPFSRKSERHICLFFASIANPQSALPWVQPSLPQPVRRPKSHSRSRRLNLPRIASHLAFALIALVAAAQAQQLSPKLQSAIGRWQTTESDGSPKGKVETYLVNGKLFGRILEGNPKRPKNDTCSKCSGEYKDQPILGLIFLRNFHPDGDNWVEGTVLDPENGSVYKGKLWAEGPGELHLRGFIGISLFGRTEVWKRLP